LEGWPLPEPFLGLKGQRSSLNVVHRFHSHAAWSAAKKSLVKSVVL